ncbi:hypothetical protein AAVH_17270 [Aphelenchoides avenae]|nr:hypothetical protein AAVH_17270 [Aphelenchus avenae]
MLDERENITRRMSKTNDQRERDSSLTKQHRANLPAISERMREVSQARRNIVRPFVAATTSVPCRLSPIEQEMIANRKEEAEAGTEEVRRRSLPSESLLEVFAFIGRRNQTWLLSLDLESGVDVFDLLRSFPCYRSVSTQTLRFLGKHFHTEDDVGKIDEVLLGKLSSMGVRETGVIEHHDRLTDEAVLEFLFANCEKAGEVKRRRILELRSAQAVSSQFCSKLVKACCESRSNHPFELYLTLARQTHFDLQQFADQVPHEALRWRPFNDGSRTWQYRFDGPRGFVVKIKDFWAGNHAESAALHVFRNCAPTRRIPDMVQLS